MSNQGFNAWAAQQPAPVGFNPAGAPPAAAPAWGAPPAPQAPPVAAPPLAQPGWGAPPPVAAPPLAQPGWGAPPPVAAPPPAVQQQQPSGGNVFGAGAFAGAASVSERKDCQYGDYVFEIQKTEQFRSREGKPMFRILCKVVHAYQGAQPIGSEVTDTINFGFPGSDEFKYGMADLLFLATYALGCGSDHEFKAKLAAAKPEIADPPGKAPGTGAWSALADAMQDANQQANPYFPPNPLKGMYYRAIVSQGAPNKKKPGEFYTEFTRMLAKAG